MTGSVVNTVLGSTVPAVPTVGMGATVLYHSDRQAATIAEVKLKKGEPVKVGIQHDHAERTDKNGMSESQEYKFTPNPAGAVIYYTKRKNGAWIRAGQGMRNGERISIGQRRHYHDFSF